MKMFKFSWYLIMALMGVCSINGATKESLSAQIDQIHLSRVHVGESTHAERFRAFVKHRGADRSDLVAALVECLEIHHGQKGGHHTVCFYGALNRLVELRAVEAAKVIREFANDEVKFTRERGVWSYVLIEPIDIVAFSEEIIRRKGADYRREREMLYRALGELITRTPLVRSGIEGGNRAGRTKSDYTRLLQDALKVEGYPANHRLIRDLLREK